MPRCEDFPCCGHEPGHCPRIGKDGREIYRCVDCGRELPKGATSSLCRGCTKALHRAIDNGDPW